MICNPTPYFYINQTVDTKKETAKNLHSLYTKGVKQLRDAILSPLPGGNRFVCQIPENCEDPLNPR